MQVTWKGGAAFAAALDSGAEFVMDTHPDHGGSGQVPTPFEAFVASSAGCSAIDVINILEKMKQKVTSYKLDITYTRGPEGVYPRPIVGMKITHILTGENLDENAVKKAVELSDTKYCSVVATLRTPVEVESVWEIA